MPHIWLRSREVSHDRLSDIARIGRPGRDRGVGRIFVSAEIIQFIRGPRRNRELSDFPTIAFRSVARRDDLVMDDAEPRPVNTSGRNR